MREQLRGLALAVGFGLALAAGGLPAGRADARTLGWAAGGDPNSMDPHGRAVTMAPQQIQAARWRFPRRDGVRFPVTEDVAISRRPADTIAEAAVVDRRTAGIATQAEAGATLRLDREPVPQSLPHHRMIPRTMRSDITIPHMANNQPHLRWAVVN